MTLRRSRLLPGIGRRLRKVREQLNHSPRDMGRRLGLSHSGYFKNESGITFPKLNTLSQLHEEYDISMDWLIFNQGPMHNKDRQPEQGEEKKTLDLEEVSSDVRELLEYMDQDPLLRYEVLVYFYKYKKKQVPEMEETPPIPNGE